MSAPVTNATARRRRIALIVAGSVAAVAIVAAGVWALTRPRDANVAVRTFTPAEETTASSPATSAAVSAALAGDGTSRTADGSVSAGIAPARSGKIVFRLGRTLYVANEDGTGAIPLKVTESEYALSPDGASIAVVRAGKLSLISVASGAVVVVGPAERVSPVWKPDSSAVLFVRAGAEGVPAAWSVARSGKNPALVGTGQGIAVSPDGTRIALLPTEAEDNAPAVTVVSSGRAKKVAVSGGDPVSVAVGNRQLFVSTLSSEGKAAIWTSALDGSGKRELVGAVPAEGKAATYGRLMLSPDGTRLAYTSDGDDGYSRIWVVPVGGGSPVQVTSRRDGYPLGWTADGKAIVFFEGNTFQGESSALWSSNPDGTNRRMIVSGAVQ